jgi:hypothetical protein
MLSRIMRHPAGLMKRALGGRFLPAAWAHKDDPAEAPVFPIYWSHRYSRMGLLLAAPAVPAPQAIPVGLVHTLQPGAAALPAQDGKASSFLSAPKVPAAGA